jgi:hypothetical protein
VWRQPGFDARVRTAAHRIDEAGNAAAAPDRDERLDPNLAADATAAQERRVVESVARLRERRQRPESRRARCAGVGLGRRRRIGGPAAARRRCGRRRCGRRRCGRRRCTARAWHPHQRPHPESRPGLEGWPSLAIPGEHAQPARGPGLDLHRRRRSEQPSARPLEQRCVGVDDAARLRRGGGTVDSGDPQVAEQACGQDHARRHDRAAAPEGPRRRCSGAGDSNQNRRSTRRCKREPCDYAADCQMRAPFPRFGAEQRNQHRQPRSVMAKSNPSAPGNASRRCPTPPATGRRT